jgi:hypothetical protein
MDAIEDVKAGGLLKRIVARSDAHTQEVFERLVFPMRQYLMARYQIYGPPELLILDDYLLTFVKSQRLQEDLALFEQMPGAGSEHKLYQIIDQRLDRLLERMRIELECLEIVSPVAKALREELEVISEQITEK